MNASLIQLVLALAFLVLSGCATVTSTQGNVTSQELTINTEPSNARCTLKRYGMELGVIESTPGSIKIGKSMANVHVVCKKDGYLDAEGSVHSHLQKAFYGNLLWGLGAGYAMVWDLSTGAPWQYDPGLNIPLIPSEFSSEAEREAFFENLRAPVKAEIQAAKDKVMETCRPDECDQQLKVLQEREAEAIQKVEQQRQLTRIKQI